MKHLSRTAIFFVLALAFSVSAIAQDTVKVSAAFQNLNVANQNLPGANVSADFKIVGSEHWRLGAVVDGSYQYDTNKTLDRYQLLGGPQVSYSFGEGRLTVFGRGLFGATRFDQRNSLKDFARMTVSVGGGFDVRLTKRFSFRPAQFDLQYIDERAARYTRLATGGVFTF